jgi:hypothetical protein
MARLFTTFASSRSHTLIRFSFDSSPPPPPPTPKPTFLIDSQIIPAHYVFKNIKRISVSFNSVFYPVKTQRTISFIQFQSNLCFSSPYVLYTFGLLDLQRWASGANTTFNTQFGFVISATIRKCLFPETKTE